MFSKSIMTKKRQERKDENRASPGGGERLFIETMENFNNNRLEFDWNQFRECAEMGHEESQWIINVVDSVTEKNKNPRANNKYRHELRCAFAETKCLLKGKAGIGHYFAFCVGFYGNGDYHDQDMDYLKQSSDAGYSWGQVEYAHVNYFEDDYNFQKLLKKAAPYHPPGHVQNNPEALYWLGYCHESENILNIVTFYLASAEMGWKASMDSLARIYLGELKGLEEADYIKAVRWSSQGESFYFWYLLKIANNDSKYILLKTQSNLLMMELGKGLYWYMYDTNGWKEQKLKERDFGQKCMDYYCENINLQQQSIFLFLHVWNKTTGGVKDPGRIIGKMVWDARYNYTLVE